MCNIGFGKERASKTSITPQNPLELFRLAAITATLCEKQGIGRQCFIRLIGWWNIHLAKHNDPEAAVWKEQEQTWGPFLSGRWNTQWPASSGNMLPWQQSWPGTGKRSLYLHGAWMFCFNRYNMHTSIVGLVCSILFMDGHSPTISPMLIYK